MKQKGLIKQYHYLLLVFFLWIPQLINFVMGYSSKSELWRVPEWKHVSFLVITSGISIILTVVLIGKGKRRVLVHNFLYGIILFLNLTSVYVYFYILATSLFVFEILNYLLLPVYGISLLVPIYYMAARSKSKLHWLGNLSLILIPLITFALYQVVLPLIRHFDEKAVFHCMLVLSVLLASVFLYMLFRLILVYFIKGHYKSKIGNFSFQLVTLFIIPLTSLVGLHWLDKEIGFCLNAEELYPLAYGFLIINALFLMLPLSKRTHRLAMLFFRSLGFFITILVFLLTLPLIPILLFLLLLGIGFFLLGSISLFISSVQVITKEVLFLSAHYSKKIIAGICLMGFFSIPMGLSLDLWIQKRSLDKAIEYVFQADLANEQKTDVSPGLLNKALHRHEETQRRIINPYNMLASLFLTSRGRLPQSRIEAIRSAYFNAALTFQEPRSPFHSTKMLQSITVESVYHEQNQTWESRVDLVIENKNGGTGEFIAGFSLPQDAMISDYYLMVNGEKKRGRLYEKSAALFVYDSIVNRRRDPGLLYYNADGTLSLKVFPVLGNEPRHTGMTILHKRPFALELGGKEVYLGRQGDPLQGVVVSQNRIYIPKEEKKNLPLVFRKPYLHFILDYSASTPLHEKLGYEERIRGILDRVPYSCRKYYRLSFTGIEISSVDSSMDWPKRIRSEKAGGGFMLARAMNKALYESHIKAEEKYPVFVVLSPKESLSCYEKVFPFLVPPETSFFLHVFGSDIKKVNITDPKDTETLEFRQFEGFLNSKVPVLAWPNRHSNGPFSAIGYLSPEGDSFLYQESPHWKGAKENPWEKGLDVLGRWYYNQLHHAIEGDLSKMIQDSRDASILTPVTAFMVVETQEQEERLKREDKKRQKKPWDSGDDSLDSMSEPGMVVYILILSVYFLWRKRRQKGISVPPLKKSGLEQKRPYILNRE